MKRLSSFSVLMALVFLPSCNRPLEQPPSQDTGSTTQGTGGGMASYYPHTNPFKVTRAHGQLYLRNPQECITCHASTAQTTGVAPACNRCHIQIPHSPDFKIPGTYAHGTASLGKLAICMGCHTNTTIPTAPFTETGLSTCKKCHEYPHVYNTHWYKPEVHGAAYVAQIKQKTPPVVTCLHCHGEKASFVKRHPDYFVSCSSCHFVVPHPGSHDTQAKSIAGNCFACHGPKLDRNLPDAQGCLGCHDQSDLELVPPKVLWKKEPTPKPEPAPGPKPGR